MQQFAEIAGRRRILFATSLLGIECQRIARSRHGYVEQTPLFFVMQFLGIAFGRRQRIAQFLRKLEQRLLEMPWGTILWSRGR